MNVRYALVVGLLMFSLVSTIAQSEREPQISVTGSAEVKVAPDLVDLSVGVDTRDQDLQPAKQKNDSQVAAVLEFLKGHGVKDKYVQTDCLTIEPEYDNRNLNHYDSQTHTWAYDSNADIKPLYYVVHRQIGIELTDVGSFDTILSGLVTNGVNMVQAINFRISDPRKYKDQAREMAVKAAREKAEAAASVLGMKVGKPSYININDSGGSYGISGAMNGYRNISGSAGDYAGEDGMALAVGQISVSATVNVSFSMQ